MVTTSAARSLPDRRSAEAARPFPAVQARLPQHPLSRMKGTTLTPTGTREAHLQPDLPGECIPCGVGEGSSDEEGAEVGIGERCRPRRQAGPGVEEAELHKDSYPDDLPAGTTH